MMRNDLEIEKAVREKTLRDLSDDIQKAYQPKDIIWLNKVKLILSEEAEKLKANYLEGKIWRDKEARFKCGNYNLIVQQIKAKVRQLEYFERQQMRKKEILQSNSAGSAAAKTLVDVITIMNRRQNAAAISQEHRNITHPEAERKQLQAQAVEAPTPECSPENAEVIAQMKVIQEQNPNLSNTEALIIAQDHISKVGIKTEDFDTSALIKRDENPVEDRQKEGS